MSESSRLALRYASTLGAGRRILCFLVVAGLAPAIPTAGHELTFEERVEAQRAIEQVYYSHLEGTRRTFEQAVTRELLERKVRTYLKQSVALESIWQTPITAEVLQREAARIARDSRFPERLAQIRVALGHDDILFQETFVRATLAGRLARSFFAFDGPTHEAARAEAESIHERLLDGTLDPLVPHPLRSVEEILLSSETAEEAPRLDRIDEDPEPLHILTRPAPSRSPEVGPLQENADSFSIRVVTPAEATAAVTYTVPKIKWEAWWVTNEGFLDENSITTVAEESDSGAAESNQCPPDDTWDNGALDALPDARYRHAAVWTGTEMIVWGGGSGPLGYSVNGGRYDPLTDTWRSMSVAGAPQQRFDDKAVWTGTEMIVWGLDMGGRYDPVADEWRSVSTVDGPGPRREHSAIWTGSEMVVWGGLLPTSFTTSTGARYDPATDTWRPISTDGAPSSRMDHAAVWTGTQMIVWGGETPAGGGFTTLFQSGGRYDPGSDSWSSTSLMNAPTARSEHSAIWTANEMIVWGGAASGGIVSSGGRYDPATDSWTQTSTSGAPIQRRAHSAIWTGTRMIVWGGASFGGGAVRGGGSYDPLLNSWQPISFVNGVGTVYHTAVWASSLMITWGGTQVSAIAVDYGGRYDPASNSWTPTSRTSGGIQFPRDGSVVWSGTEMIVFNGTGGRYDPLVDSWRPVSRASAPIARTSPLGVWTGNEMMFYGGVGENGITPDRTGGLYDPVQDSWRPISMVGAPAQQSGSTVVWTGSEAIFWGGGRVGSSVVRQGAGYDPSTDTWRNLPLDNEHRAFLRHTAVWTGHDMILLGGDAAAGSVLATRYDPVQNRWYPMSGFFSWRTGHSAIWTGHQMIVHGGRLNLSNILAPPVIYDLAANSWDLLPTPMPDGTHRSNHSAVWTGRHMLIWGSEENGLIYDHVSGTWSVMSKAGQPLPRSFHDAIWTGSSMLIWGGTASAIFHAGGRYRFGQNSDDDGDLLSECDGDCDDIDPEAWPGAPERCNGRDDSCDALIDEDADGLDSDSDGTPNACDACPQFANPGQIAPLACMAAAEDGGTCLETGVILASPLDEGIVSVLRTLPATPDVIHLDFFSITCGTPTPVEVFLNEELLAVYLFGPNCEEGDVLFHRRTVSDVDRLRAMWNIGGANVLRIRKAAFDGGELSGTVFGWARAQIGSSARHGSETTCIFDASDRNCTQGNSGFNWFTFAEVDASRTVNVHLTAEETLQSASFTDTLPESLDISHLPDGELQLCVGSSALPLLLAAEADGSLYVVDETTGATTFYGAMESATLELAHDDRSRLTVSQMSSSDPRSLQQIRLTGPQSLGVLPYVGPHLSGLELIEGKLYGVEPTGRGARMLEIVTDTGSARVIRTLDQDGSWDGLAYDEMSGTSYTIVHYEDSHTIWSIEPRSGLMTGPVSLELTPKALEVGPDGSLYASQDSGTDTELYRLDPGTGMATLVGSMGIADVVSLVTVHNHPRSCIDMVKQGEQTLAINGSCNTPPSASAGSDRSEECTSFAGAVVSLDASASADSDSSAGTNDDIVLFEWLEHLGTPDEVLLGTGESLQIPLSLGPHHVTLRVTDAAGERGLDQVAIEVSDTHSPVIAASLLSDNNRFATSRRSGHRGDDDDDDGGHHGDDDDDDGGHHGDDDDDDGGHHGDDDDGGRFIAVFSAVDACDPNPVIIGSFLAGVCGAHLTESGQTVKFERDDTCEIEIDDGILQIEAQSLSLHVTATDGSGNQSFVETFPGESHTPLQTYRDGPGTNRNGTIDQTPATLEKPAGRKPVRRSSSLID